jgi:TolB-like protein
MSRVWTFMLTMLAAAPLCAAAQEPAAEPPQPTLLVLPIAAPAGQYSWVGTAIQQDMAVDLTRLTKARVIAPSRPTAQDEAGALQAGRDAGAAYVVHASARLNDNQLRVSGQLSEVATGRVLSPVAATAPVDDLFPLEDALAMQVARGMPNSLANNLPAPQTQPAAAPESQTPVAQPPSASATPPEPAARVEPAGPPVYESVQTPAPEYYFSAPGGSYPYVYPYPYPYYGYPYYYGGYWSYGWWGPGVVIVPHYYYHYHPWGWGYHGNGWYGHPNGGANGHAGPAPAGHGGGANHH